MNRYDRKCFATPFGDDGVRFVYVWDMEIGAVEHIEQVRAQRKIFLSFESSPLHTYDPDLIDSKRVGATWHVHEVMFILDSSYWLAEG